MDYEQTKKQFDYLVSQGDWNSVNELMLDLQERGNSDMEIELWETVSQEDLADYKRWDKGVNGDTDTQMDDNS